MVSFTDINTQLLLAAFIGSILPEIVRLIRILRVNGRTGLSWRYLLFSLVLIILSLLTVILLNTETLFAAFYTGLATPPLITATLRAGTNKDSQTLRSPPKKSKTKSWFYQFIEAF